MDKYPSATIIEHFSNLEDPRISRAKLHPLINILTIALCGGISGADTWVDTELFGESKEEWFASFLDMSRGLVLSGPGSAPMEARQEDRHRPECEGQPPHATPFPSEPAGTGLKA